MQNSSKKLMLIRLRSKTNSFRLLTPTRLQSSKNSFLSIRLRSNKNIFRLLYSTPIEQKQLLPGSTAIGQTQLLHDSTPIEQKHLLDSNAIEQTWTNEVQRGHQLHSKLPLNLQPHTPQALVPLTLVALPDTQLHEHQLFLYLSCSCLFHLSYLFLFHSFFPLYQLPSGALGIRNYHLYDGLSTDLSRCSVISPENWHRICNVLHSDPSFHTSNTLREDTSLDWDVWRVGLHRMLTTVDSQFENLENSKQFFGENPKWLASHVHTFLLPNATDNTFCNHHIVLNSKESIETCLAQKF